MTLENPTWYRTQGFVHRLRAIWLIGLLGVLLASCLNTPPSAISNPVFGPSSTSKRVQALDDEQAFLFYLLGQLYVREQQWEEAEEAFEQVIKLDKSAIEARVFASHLAVQQGKIDEAIAYSREIIKLDPKRMKSRMLLTSLLTAQKNYSEAALHYETMLNQDGNNATVRLLLAQVYGHLNQKNRVLETLTPLFQDAKLGWKAYLTLGRALASMSELEEATKAFYRSHELAADKIQPVLALGVVLQKLNRPDESEKVYRDYLSDHPENKAIHSRLGRLLLNQNNRGGALEEFRTISNLAPGNIQARLTTGLILLSERNYEEALQELRLAEATEPSNSTVQYYIGQTQEFLNQPEKSEATYLKIASGEPFYPEAQLRLAHIETLTDRTASAIERVENLVTKFPQKVEFIKALSLIQLQVKQYEDVVRVTSKGLDIEPENSDLRFNRAMAYDKLGRWNEAEQDLRHYVEKNPNDAHALNYLGYTWAEKNIYLKESRKLLERAAKLAPDDGFVSDSLGWVLYRLKEYKESLNQMQKAVQLEPSDPTIHEHLGDVLMALGEKKRALEVWKKALELGPENQKLQEKIKKMTQ
ncbi:MAG: tetratricopeptide repeat protein [Magnetococcales bacterium]|nr:tetratricopeptide repeat protein [Magnetococcales bacterium]